MKGPPHGFWGKLSGSGPGLAWHPLADHCADVGACAEALLRETALGDRLARIAGRKAWTDEHVARLSVLATLHDLGKFNAGFQSRWRSPDRAGPGHVGPAVSLFAGGADELGARFVEAIQFDELQTWGPGVDRLLLASVCHHGKPLRPEDCTSRDRSLWDAHGGADPFDGIRGLLDACRRWFAPAFGGPGAPLPDCAHLQHGLSGLVTLADWIGSDVRRFRYAEPGDAPRIEFARAAALDSLRALGLATRPARSRLPAGAPSFDAVAPGRAARPAQQAMAAVPIDDDAPLVILEAETGSGKTEAALLHFLRLFQAGAVDGMYFALPTRTAATEIQKRVDAAAASMFPDEATRPPVILAVPGYLRVDDREGVRDAAPLAPFSVLWNDADAERWRYRGWAAENPKRFLAGAIAVGTIDQVLLSTLSVPHAHMRSVALMRQLLVVDEIHASDAYMTRLLASVLRRHVESGGRALLLSATLGTTARDALASVVRRGSGRLTAAEATRAPFPAITVVRRSAPADVRPVPAAPRGRRSVLRIEPIAQDPPAVAALVIEAAGLGARVLVIRNTVHDAIATQLAVESVAARRGREALLFRCNGVPAPYHARFSSDDRVALDAAVLSMFRDRRDSGVVLVATQTAQQSLDIDADVLVTDLCPADVLLQRLGRVHRHDDARRPPDFAQASAHVLTPSDRDLTRFVQRTGGARGPCGLGTVYEDLRVLEATWRWIERSGAVAVPDDCRAWVESCTHPDMLSAIESDDPEGRWRRHRIDIEGRLASHRNLAALHLVDWSEPFGSRAFPGAELEQRIATRLGTSDRRAVFEEPIPGPFGISITELRIPGWWMAGLADDVTPIVESAGPDEVRFRTGVAGFRYSRLGLERTAARPGNGASGADDDLD